MNGNSTRQKTTESLIQAKQSDYERWSSSESLMPSWNERTKLIGSLIPSGSSVFEFGAGTGVLQNYLPSGCKYQKSDLVDRDGCTVILDLNAEQIESITGFSTAVLSGVLEYIHDIPKLINYLAQHFETVIFSYACLDKNQIDRRNHGWVNDYTIEEIILILKNAGFGLYNYRTWKTQTILCVTKLKGNTNPALYEIEYTFSISLEKYLDRQQLTMAEMAALGLRDFSFYPAINHDDDKVKNAFKYQLIKTPETCFRCGQQYCQCSNNVLIPKQIGNWLSFLSVFHIIKLGQYSVAMICEDDVKFTYYASNVFNSIKDNKEIINNLKSDIPTLVRLGYPGFNENIHSYNGNINFSQARNMSNSCFICNSAYANHVIKSINTLGKISHTSDVYFHNLCLDNTVKTYTAIPPPAFDLSQSLLIYSSIHPKSIDPLDIKRERIHVKKVFNSIGLAKVFGGNFGDMLGGYIFEKIVEFSPEEIFINNKEIKNNNKSEHYLIAGSILKHTTEKAWLWGIGIMHHDDASIIANSIVPEQIYALRGPKTKEALEGLGIQLPDNVALGDPGILLPLLNQGASKKEFLFGIVPHCTELEAVRERYKGHPNVTIISLENHDSNSCIDKTIYEISKCERILSSSLHGIIVAHAYGIQAAWCNFSEITKNQQSGTTRLKFQDYYESVNIFGVAPTLCLSENAEFPKESNYTLPEQLKIEKIQSELLEYCPFNLLGYNRNDLLRRQTEQINTSSMSFSDLLAL
jgi:hypothetical protein